MDPISINDTLEIDLIMKASVPTEVDMAAVNLMVDFGMGRLKHVPNGNFLALIIGGYIAYREQYCHGVGPIFTQLSKKLLDEEHRRGY